MRAASYMHAWNAFNTCLTNPYLLLVICMILTSCCGERRALWICCRRLVEDCPLLASLLCTPDSLLLTSLAGIHSSSELLPDRRSGISSSCSLSSSDIVSTYNVAFNTLHAF
jgi:hypothetical protein